ncbi:putative phosphoribosyltransferase [Halarchaeum solikamskense]|uniref:VWA domain-containing protein n=1 Tax=Halarchaeum nitratireducens TaxID=489913 RepID=UPI001B3A7FFA|nr:putative phosphoribosyltransferase [Halarchaeum solikamskense]
MTVTVAGVTAGLTTPLALLAAPVALVALWGIVAYRADGTASRRSRLTLLTSRAVIVVLLVGAAAGPYTVASAETPGDPHVTLLTDRSDSMNVTEPVDGLTDAIEREGVPVTTATVGEGTRSRIGDGVAANLQSNGSVVVVSDGQVTGGRSLAATAELARSLNATISAVDVTPTRTERHVRVSGPAKTSVGVENSFLASVDGVETDGDVALRVTVDGTEVVSRTLDGTGTVSFSHTFETTGSHRVTATIDGEDVYDVNDASRRSVSVVERPRVLYVSRGDYPLRDYLGTLYDVQTASSVPSNLDPYYAVVVQNLAADDLGNTEALQRFVIDGGGLVVAGGDRAFEHGDYAQSAFGSMLPVTAGAAGGSSANVVLAVDVSGSAQGGLGTQKAIALDALSQLGDSNSVGVVAFNSQAYRIADLRPLGESRAETATLIRRLTAGGATDIAAGLRGADELLGEERGTVILVSDGFADREAAVRAASALGDAGTRVISVGVGESTDEGTLRGIADASGGTYYRADETNRLSLQFGDAARRYRGSGLTVVDPNSFVTAGVTLRSNPGRANAVSVKPGADYLVATADGTPAVAAWRYGLGRVLTITAHDADSSLDGLLSRPDSLLVTKSINYAIGDPERKRGGVTDVADTRVGEPTTVTYRGAERPRADGLDFRAVGDGVYRATVTPSEPGYESVLGATYATNYPAEYGAFGPAPALSAAVDATGGRTFEPDEAAAIASFAREQSTQVRSVRTEWGWLCLLGALLVLTGEIVVRRLLVYRGAATNRGGLP